MTKRTEKNFSPVKSKENCTKLDDEHDGEYYLKEMGIYNDEVSVKKQVLVALGPTLLGVTSGLTSGFSAVLLPQLEDKDSTFHVSEDEKSWIAALSVLPMVLGCILGVWVMEKFGRKLSMMFCCIPFAIGWLLFCFAQNTMLIMLGRLITGMVSGYIAPSAMVYLGESVAPKYRGFMLAGISFGISFGVLWAHVMGTFLSWRVVAAVSSVTPIICLLQMYYVPESPVWLAKKNKEEEARAAFYWIRGSGKTTEKELERVLDCQNIEKPSRTMQEYFQLLISPTFLKPFTILAIFLSIAQWSGNNAITFYTVKIINQTMGTELNEYMSMIIVDVVRIVLSVMSCYLIERMGRRNLSFTSGYGSAFSLLGLALLSFLSSQDIHTPPIISLLLLVSFMGFVTVGLVPIPWSLVGEIYPLEVRDFGSGMSSVVAFIMMFGVVKTGPHMFDVWGSTWTYIFYGTVCLVGTTVLIFILPETKGKILQDIEEDIKGIDLDEFESQENQKSFAVEKLTVEH